MAMSVLKKTSALPVEGGQEGMKRQIFHLQWSTTDATGTFGVQFRRVLYVTGISSTSAVDSDEINYWSDTKLSDGTFTVGSDGLVSFARTGGSPVSGSTFCVEIYGY